MEVEDDQRFEQVAHRDQQAAYAREAALLKEQKLTEDKKEAIDFILGKIGELGPTGAFDIEPSLLKNLIGGINDGSIIDFKDVKARAQKIIDDRILDH